MKRLYMTPCDGFKPHTKDDVLAHWHAGNNFKAYQGPKFNISHLTGFKVNGCQEIMFVWQRDDKTVHNLLLEI